MLVKMRCYKLYCLHVHDWVDGQKIAKKLSVQITKEGRNIRGLLEKYSVVSAGDKSQALTLQEALDPELVESRLQAKGSYTAIASGERSNHRQLFNAMQEQGGDEFTETRSSKCGHVLRRHGTGTGGGTWKTVS